LQSRERVPHAEGILLEEPDPDPISWTATRSRGEAESTGEFAEHECAVFVGTAADVFLATRFIPSRSEVTSMMSAVR